METYIDPVAYRVDPNFDLEAHQKRYCWRGLDTPRISEAEDADKQATNDSIELPAAA
jgi:hypothetical protein